MANNRQTLSQITQRIQGNIEAHLPGAEARLQRSNLYIIAVTLSGVMKELYAYVEDAKKQIHIQTCDDENLNIKANTFNVKRKSATFAEGTATFTAEDGSAITAGTIVQRSDKEEFIVLEDATALNGNLNVGLRAVKHGVNGNTAATSKVSLISPIAGIDNQGVVDSSGIENGQEPEANDLLKNRLLERIQKPPQGGSESDYMTWAKEVPGVTRAWVFPQNRGVGTVDVAVVMDAKQDSIMPTDEELSTVQAHLDLMRPVTADSLAFKPIAVPLALHINVNPNSPAIQASVLEEIKDYLARKAEPGQTLYISQIREAISLAVGENHHELISPTENIAHEAREIAVLGDITWGA